MSSGPEVATDSSTGGSPGNPKRQQHAREFRIPQIGTSLVTGLTGSPTWGALNKSSKASRYAIGESDCDDLQNWLPLGGHFIQVPANGSAITTLPSPMIWQTEVFLNAQVYIFSMCQNGHVYQTNPSGATTDVYAAGQTSQVGNATNGSAIITGLSTATLSVGMTVTGTGIPANTTISSIDSGSQIHISNNYTGVTGSVTLNFGTPLFTTSGTVDIATWQATTVILSDSAAQKVYSWNGTNLLIVFNAQPVQYIAVFNSRLWMCQGLTVEWTNINTYNSLAGDSGSYLITDNAALNPINCAIDSPYGLFISGSNWFKFIYGLQDAGVPAVLTFSQNTVEQQIGPLNKWAVIVIGNVVFFSNNAGVWAVNGGQPSQISQPFLNGFFSNFDYTKTSLSMAYGMIDSLPCLFVQAYYQGDTQVAAGYTVFGFTLQTLQWFRISQGNIAWISGTVSTAIANNNPTVWGCDGTNIFPMLANTSSNVTCQLNTKLWDLGSVLDVNLILNVAVEFLISSQATITVAQLDEFNQIVRTSTDTISPNGITILNNSGQVISILNNSLLLITILSNVVQAFQLFQDDGCGRVRRYGLNISITGALNHLLGLVVTYHDTETGRGT